MKERSKKEIDAAVLKLNGMRKKVLILGLAFLVLCICDAVCLLIFSKPAGAAGAFVLALGYLLYLRKVRKQYQQEFVKETLLSGTATECSEIAYDGNKEQLQGLNRSSLFPLAAEKDMSLFKGFRADYKKLKVLANECAIQMEHIDKSRGNRNLHIISGSAYTITMNGAADANTGKDGEILVYQKRVPTYNHHLKLLAGAYVLANEKGYDVKSDKIVIYLPKNMELTDEITAKLQQVERLANKLETPFALALSDDHVISVLGGLFYAQDISPRYAITEKALKINRLPEFTQLLKFAEEYLGQ